MKFSVGPATALTVMVVATSVVAETPRADGQGPIGGSAGPSMEQLQAQAGTSEGQRLFDIPAQPLASALNAFGRQAGLQITIDAALTAGVQAQAVSGTMTPAEALNRLLAGTGIAGRFTGNRTVVLGKPTSGDNSGAVHLDPVQVQGFPVPPQAQIDNIPPPYAGGQVAAGSQLGLLGNRGVMDTPFNQTSYTAKKVQNQQAQTVLDALIDDPSVRTTWTGNSGSRDDMTIRGFRVGSQDVGFGGLYGILPFYSIVAELPERIEVLKGPSAMLNGMPPSGGIGGSVNLVPKRAPDDPLTQVIASYNSVGQFGGHVDAGRRFGSDKQFGVRFNGVYRAGQTAVQYNTDQTGLASLGLDFRGERIRLSADIAYQYQYIGGMIAMPSIADGVPVPGVPKTSNNFGQPWSYQERKDLFGMFRAEADLTEGVTAYATFGVIDSRIRYLSTGFPTIVAANGNDTQIPVNGGIYSKALAAEAGLRAVVDTGPISHELAFAATTFDQESGVGFVTGGAFASNIYTPTLMPRPNIADPSVNRASTGTLSSFAFADTMSAADKRIQLTVGGRLQRVTAQNFNIVTGAETSGYDQSAFSPSAALIFKPWQNVSLYGNYIQGLQRGAVVGAGFANAGQALPPYKATQLEVGVKVDWGKFTTTLSAFQISQPSAIIDITTNTMNVNGEQRNRGIELNVFGEPTEGLRLLGGVMFLDAVLTRTAGGVNDGWIAPGSPGVQLNLGTEWDTPFVRGLTLNGRVIYTGSQYLDTSYPRRSIPDWARFDIGARYTFDTVKNVTNKPVTIRFNVENLLDTNYWATANGGLLVQGMPRTFRLSTAFDF